MPRDNLDYTTKTCPTCEQEKHITAFGKSGKYIKKECKDCLNEKSKERYQKNREEILKKDRERRLSNLEETKAKQREKYHKNPSKTREYNLKRYFGITLEDYDRLLEEQNGGCAICGKTPEQEGRNLAVDHDHHTLAIRGLLCGWCNRHFVGHHRNPELFTKAGEYLSKHTGLFVPTTAPKRKRSRKKKKINK